MTDHFFVYGQAEIDHLSKACKPLGRLIQEVGLIERQVEPDLFSAVVHHIAGQQISLKAQATVWSRLERLLGCVTAERIASASEESLRACGLTLRKVRNIQSFSAKVMNGTFDCEAVSRLSDEEAIAALVTLDGVGRWTAEMVLLFCLQRPDILSFGDYGIRLGLCRLLHRQTIDKETFLRYKKRFSPYASTASFYLWRLANTKKI